MAELYFTVEGTESEHYYIEDVIRTDAQICNIDVVYYRKFKTGHVPLYRECKIVGKQKDINKFKSRNNKKECPIKFGNYWRDIKC